MGTKAEVHVKRDASGMVVTINAPQLARFVQDYCKQQTGKASPTTPTTADLREIGPLWDACNVAGLGAGVRALSFITRWRGSDGCFVEGEGGSRDDDFGSDAINLFMLRAAKALEGPVTYTFRGLYSKESAQKYMDTAIKVLGTAYKELTTKFDKRVVITLEEVNPQIPALSNVASGAGVLAAPNPSVALPLTPAASPAQAELVPEGAPF